MVPYRVILSGVEKLTRSSLKGVSNTAVFAYKTWRFISCSLLLGIGFLQASTKANLSLKSPSPKHHLNRTRSVFALSILRYYRCDTPYRATFSGRSASSPKWCDTTHWRLVLHRHIGAIPYFATYRPVIARYPDKNKHQRVLWCHYKYRAI